MYFRFLILVVSGTTIGRAANPRIVHTSEELTSAIKAAVPGDEIQLGPTTFRGEFILSSSGSPIAPITIRGTNEKSKLVGMSPSTETAFQIEGNHWHLKYFSVENYNFGVVMKGNENTLTGLAVADVNGAVDISGERNTVSGCAISNDRSFGILVQGNNAVLSGNSVQGKILIADNTCCGNISGNVANGNIEVKGSKYAFQGNVFQGGLFVTGCQNSFAGEVSKSPVFTTKCGNIDLGGNVFF